MGEVSQIEKEKDSQDQDNDTESRGKDQASTEIFPSGDQSKILKETNAQNGAWSTQPIESQNEKISQQSSIFKDQYGHRWKICNATARLDCIPCLDNLQAIRMLSSTKHYEHRGRYCPEEACTLLLLYRKDTNAQLSGPKAGIGFGIIIFPTQSFQKLRVSKMELKSLVSTSFFQVAKLNLRMVLFITLTSF